MHLAGHRLPDTVLPALLFTFVIAVCVWAALWMRLGPIRSSMYALLVTWTGVVLAYTLAPKKRLHSHAHPHSCRLQLPDHFMGILTNDARATNFVLYLPIGALAILASRNRERLYAVAVALLMPIGVEGVQLLLPPLHQACQTMDIYDSWTGVIVGGAFVLAAMALYRRTPFGRVRNAQHRRTETRVSGAERIKAYDARERALAARAAAEPARPASTPTSGNWRLPTQPRSTGPAPRPRDTGSTPSEASDGEPAQRKR